MLLLSPSALSKMFPIRRCVSVLASVLLPLSVGAQSNWTKSNAMLSKPLTLQPVNITALFPADGEPTTICFERPAGAPAETVYSYKLRDYLGRIVSEGQAKEDGENQMSVSLSLPAGYYEIDFGQPESQPTGIWSVPPLPTSDKPSDLLVSIDTALCWNSEMQNRLALIENLATITGGLGLVRDRISWLLMNSEEGQWDWETKSHYESTRRLYDRAGLKLLEVFHHAPEYLGRTPQGDRVPDDLVKGSRSWSTVAERMNGSWAALEAWNEPDVFFGGFQPADQYVPLVKMVRHALRTAGVETPVVGGVFASMNPSYLDLAARNGLLDESDVISFHYYGNALRLEQLVSQYRAWLAESGHETKPLWLTESNQWWPAKPGLRPTLLAQMNTALNSAMQVVEARACGLGAFFPFIYVDYSEYEGTRQFGLLDISMTPLRVLPAWAHTARLLSGTAYIGDLPTAAIPGSERIRVFAPPGEEAGDPDSSAFVVIYTGKVFPGGEVEPTKVPFPVQKAYGIDGRVLEVVNDSEGRTASFPLTDGLVILRVPRSPLSAILDVHTDTMRLYRLGHPDSPPPGPPTPSSIVLQPRVERADVQAITSQGYFLPVGATRLPVTVRVNNLGSEPRTVRLQVAGAPEKVVTVAADARESVTVDVDLSQLSPAKTGDALRLPISATADNGERIAPAELSLIGGQGIGEHLSQSDYQFILSLNETYRWDRNSNGKLDLSRTPEGAVSFSVKFREGEDHWSYPRFTLPQEVDQAKVTGILLRARCLKPATVRVQGWNEKDERFLTAQSIIPSDGEWHVVYVPLTGLREDKSAGKPFSGRLTKLSLGINSKGDENTFEISNLCVVGK